MPTRRCGPGRAGGAAEAGNRVAGPRLDNTAPPADQIVLHRLRRQRLIEAVHRLGPRVVGELLDEIARYHDLRDDIDRRLAAYAALDPGLLRALGGDMFPQPPLHRVAGDYDGG